MPAPDFPLHIIALSAVGLLVTGAIAGTLAGLLGVGGGIVIVPVLFWLLGFLGYDPALIMHLAVGTSLATIIPTSISSMRAHAKKGAVDIDLLKRWGPMIVIGAALGGISSKFIDAAGLKFIFGFFALAVSVNMVLPKPLKIRDDLPESPLAHGSIAGIIGYFSSLMGIGGGTFSVPTLTAFSFPIHRAVGTASAIGLMIALPAVIGFIWAGVGVENRPPLSFGYLNVAAAVIIFPITVLFAPFGARLAHSLDPKGLKRAFALFLAITASRMLYSAFTV
ncbi:sulfite exporter TauE/SafE family protein [Aestuariispira insulae]|uniref:Probable membrane transporter protein n=1 Tax=Aestuariispira insulae TaxID=1461337 RepID=A0A3D9HK76_9PROT|nr:sulfite exporter TauE/SafE family protein [Aestuariispira insulae]RED49899.1 putative membrane protein YfcA [Aestuariispira insulae]